MKSYNKCILHMQHILIWIHRRSMQTIKRNPPKRNPPKKMIRKNFYGHNITVYIKLNELNYKLFAIRVPHTWSWIPPDWNNHNNQVCRRLMSIGIMGKNWVSHWKPSNITAVWWQGVQVGFSMEPRLCEPLEKPM